MILKVNNLTWYELKITDNEWYLIIQMCTKEKINDSSGKPWNRNRICNNKRKICHAFILTHIVICFRNLLKQTYSFWIIAINSAVLKLIERSMLHLCCLSQQEGILLETIMQNFNIDLMCYGCDTKLTDLVIKLPL